MKIKLNVDLLRDNGTSILGPGQTITKTGSTHSEAKGLIQVEIDARVATATQTQQDLNDANTAFNS
jgi:hypothetical protein